MSSTGRQCFRHPDKPAFKVLCVPCASGGSLWVCAECAKTENGKAVFDAYQATHAKHIRAFKQENPGS